MCGCYEMIYADVHVRCRQFVSLWMFCLWQHNNTFYKSINTNFEFCLNFYVGEAHTKIRSVLQIKNLAGAKSFLDDSRIDPYLMIVVFAKLNVMESVFTI